MSAAEDRRETVRMIRDSAAAIVPPGGDLKHVRALRFTTPGFDHGVWRQMCELGWTGLRVPEEAGGAGLGMAEFCAVAEEMGTGLVPEPLIAAAMAAQVIRGSQGEALLSGARIILPAWQERANTLAPGTDTAFDGARVSGKKVFVHMAAGADAFLVTTAGGLALVEADAPGVSISVEPTQDGGHFGTLRLDDAPGAPLDGDLDDALDAATLATASYLLGAMSRAFALTLDYLKTRQQFGRPIGSFQALQHRAADLQIQLSLTRASVESAAATLDAAAAKPLRQAAASRAKARASDAAMLITRQAIQLHGGVGYTDEDDVGLFLRKTMVLANLYGSAAAHRARFAAIMPDEDDV